MAGENTGKVAHGDKVGLTSLGHFDMNVYTSGDKSGYVTSIPANEEEDVSLPTLSPPFPPFLLSSPPFLLSSLLIFFDNPVKILPSLQFLNFACKKMIKVSLN